MAEASRCLGDSRGIMLAPHPSRLRSNSSPIRPQGGHPESTLSSEIQPASSTSPQKPSELPRTRSGSISFFAAPSQSSGGIRKSKLFRLKRPSSSSAALQPNYRSDLVAEPPSTTPPRPPRNPARATPVARPSSSSGVPSAQRKLQRVRSLSTTSHSRESSPHRGFGPILEVSQSARSQHIFHNIFIIIRVGQILYYNGRKVGRAK